MKPNTRIAVGAGIAAAALLLYYRQKQQAAIMLPATISPNTNQATVSSIGNAIGGLFTNIANLITFQGDGVSTGNTPLPASVLNTGDNLGTVVSPDSLLSTFTASNNDQTLIQDAQGYLWGRVGAPNGDNTIWYNSLWGSLTTKQLEARL